jgi:hypothetical protein
LNYSETGQIASDFDKNLFEEISNISVVLPMVLLVDGRRGPNFNMSPAFSKYIAHGLFALIVGLGVTSRGENKKSRKAGG